MFKMEKHPRRQESNLQQFNRNVPGCFWNIFQAIDHHPWHNVKKMLPYKKHSRSKGGPKSTLNNQHVAEVPEQINVENKPLFCTADSCVLDRRSGEAHVSEVVTKEMSEEESIKDRKSSSNSKPRLSRIQSIHHFDPSHCSPENNGDIGGSGVTPQQKTAMKLAASELKSNSLNALDTDFFVQGKIAVQSTPFTEKSNEVKKTLETNQVDRNISGRSFKEDAHIQEIFKANRKLFADLLYGAHGNHTVQTPKKMKSTASLSKSRSFPAPGLARKEYKKLGSLQHKLTESFPSKLVESDSPNNIRQQPRSSLLGQNRGLKYVGWNQLVIKRFNFIKHKIRHSFKERKKGNNQKRGKRIPTADPSGHELILDRKEAQESSEITASEDGSDIRGYSETASSEDDNLDKGIQTKTVTASLNASLERYSQLSEEKSNCPKSIRLRSEEKIPIREKPINSIRRNLSMPDIELFYTLFTDPPHGVSRTEKPKSGSVPPGRDNSVRRDENRAHLLNADISGPLDSAAQSVFEKGDENMPVVHLGSSNKAENDEGTAWPAELGEKIPYLDISDSKRYRLLEVEDVSENADDDSDLSYINQVLNRGTCFQDGETLKLSNSEGAILNPWCSITNELEPSNDESSEASTEALSAFETIVNHEIIDDTEKISLSFLLHSEPDRIDNGAFDYMRYILQLTNLIESDRIIDRPRSSIFEGEEAHSYRKLDCSWEKVDKDSDQQLMIDLVYETLHNVFEKTFICFLKAFSSKSQLRPMPLGLYVLEEVREKVAWYLSLGPELDQFLDDVVERDLRKDDDWMNLESESEYIALELEDLILDDLLDETISFRIFLGRYC